jgi:Fe-S-cluster containining protein
MSEQGEAPWYAGGLRFECTQCGNCCTGPPGYVWFDEEEGRALARALGVAEETFHRRYARRLNGRWSLRERRTEHGHDCVFLDRRSENGKALCRVYDARPAQCRTWPFWPENLSSPDDWSAARRATPCPGMDQGTLISVEGIRLRLEATPD